FVSRVHRGDRFGVLGPNGAGKTTLIKILVTLLLPSSGEAFVDGLDVIRQFRELRHRIAMVSGGENVGFGMLKVKEQLWMFSQFYGMPSAPSKRRIDELLERLGLSDAADRRVSALSSGMRQKMNLIRGLITNPRILFLDEPTVALDVGAARHVRDEVRRWMAEDPGPTVILTTHYMRQPVGRSAGSRNASPPLRMPSSSWLVGGWRRKSRREPSIGHPDLPQDDRSSRLSALRGGLSKPCLACHGDALAPDRDDCHDLRLSRAACAPPLSRICRAGRGATGLLAKRDLGDGDAIFLGSRRRQPRALRHGADQPDGHPAGHGFGGRRCQPDPGGHHH